MTMLGKLGDSFVQDMDVEDALHHCFSENWDNQRKVTQGSTGEVFTIDICFSASVSMADAKKALESFQARTVKPSPVR